MSSSKADALPMDPPMYSTQHTATDKPGNFALPADASIAQQNPTWQQTAPGTLSLDQPASTVAPPSYGASKHGIFGSEDEYLAALSRWAESQKYIKNTPQSLVGFYGRKTSADVLNQPGGISLSRRSASRDISGAAGQSAESDRSSRRKSSLVPSFLRKRSTTQSQPHEVRS